MLIRPSPIVALNRAIAIAQSKGPEHGLDEIGHIADRDRLATYPFYFAALGELRHRWFTATRIRTPRRLRSFAQISIFPRAC
jgi:predicted RNA polymerase sigma factor